jgi:5'(3')-deoxyribonucleotidase
MERTNAMTPHFILDMDGVTADFVTATIQRHQRTETHDQIRRYDYWKDWGISTEQFWSKANGRTFWSQEIRPYHWAYELTDCLSQFNFTICSRPSHDIECVPGKIEWMERHFPSISHDQLMFGCRKELLAADDTILIDDDPNNIDKFRRRGGRAILFPQPWNNAMGNWESVIYQVRSISKEMERT